VILFVDRVAEQDEEAEEDENGRDDGEEEAEPELDLKIIILKYYIVTVGVQQCQHIKRHPLIVLPLPLPLPLPNPDPNPDPDSKATPRG